MNTFCKIENRKNTKQQRKKISSSSAMGSRNDEGCAYASTTASPPAIQISLDDSVDTDYKETHYVNGCGLISPGTDFSEQVRASHSLVCLLL